MSANVFANGREIAAQESSNQSIAAMPDVCMSPPPPPAGPVPVPYPNFSQSSDTTAGSKTVKVGGKPAMLKNASTYSTSKGNEPATNNFGANVITHKIKGKTKFAAWSFDVLIEGQNVVRLLDLTTHNHANPGGGAATTSTGLPGVATPALESCKELNDRNTKERTRQRNSSRRSERRLARLLKSGYPKVPNAIVHVAASLPPLGTSSVFGASHRSSLSPKSNQGAKGAGKSGNSPNICPPPGKKFKYTGFRHQYHAEAKALESIMEAAKGVGRPSVTLAINWLSAQAPTPKSPCDDCADLIKHAKSCMDIKIC